MTRQNLLILALIVAVAFPLGAQEKIARLDGSTITGAQIDSTVQRLMKAASVTGVGIAIFNHGEPVYLRAYGFRDTEKHLPLTPNSVMTAASLTKAAFAYMVMQLVQERRLDLDKPVYEYLPKPLPEYPNYADLAGDARYKTITARMLLAHTSGFPNWRFLNDDHKLNINFEPGSRFAYSGEGIDLLQMMVETTTREPLEKLMQERVFVPLGMSHTGMVWQKRFESDYANGYDEYGRSLGPQKRTAADAAGGMQTTLADYARFLEAVMQSRGLHSTTRDLMLTPQVRIYSKHEFPSLAKETTTENDAIRLSYGLGWGLYFTPYGKAFFKEGHDEGWRHYAVGFDDGDGLLIMTNSSNGEGVFQYLLEALLGDHLTPIVWEGFTPYDKLPALPPLVKHSVVKVDSKSLDSYAGRYGLPPNIVETIRKQGDHLTIQESVGANAEPAQELQPESANEFFSTTSDDEFSFIADSNGHITKMVLHSGEKNIDIPRLP